MSDLKIREFRERAEHAVVLPDLADLQRRGRALRRRRAAAVAGALAVVLLAGAAITRLEVDGTDATPAPAAPPSTTPGVAWDSGVRTRIDAGEDVLLRGRSVATYDGVSVRFDVPGDGWEWWDAGLGLRRTPRSFNTYAAAVFFLRDVDVRVDRCSHDRVRSLGADPERLLANVAALEDLAGTTVLDGPRVVPAFGGEAVHLRLLTRRECPAGDGGPMPAGFRGWLDGEPVAPGWGEDRVLDVWHVVVPGPESVLVASWDLGGTRQQRAQQQALLDSVRIGPDLG